MPASTIARRQVPVRYGWKAKVVLATAALVALATIAGGLIAVVVHARLTVSEHVLAPAGMVLILSALVQFRTVFRVWQARSVAALERHLIQGSFLRALLLVTIAGYGATLAIGPVPFIACAWLAIVAACYSMLLLPLAAPPRVVEGWRQWSESRTGRRLAWVVFVPAIVALCAELGLRTQRTYQQDDLLADGASSAAIASREMVEVQTSIVDEIRSGPFRVAVATDPQLNEPARSDYLKRVQQILPGLEIVPSAMPRPWTAKSAEVLADQLAAAKVSLVLVVVEACQNVGRPVESCGWFDWRKLAIAEKLFGTEAAQAPPRTNAPSHTDNFESFLRGLAPQMAVCRAPLDDAMELHWKQAFAGVDRLQAECHARRLPMALVLVPGQFQVNRSLASTLAARLGFASGQLDLELPQRKWAGFAEPRNLPLVDLLPPLRVCREGAYERHTGDWNTTGNAVAAATISGWLESRYGGQLAIAAQLTGAP
jgi:hypothetical protein